MTMADELFIWLVIVSCTEVFPVQRIVPETGVGGGMGRRVVVMLLAVVVVAGVVVTVKGNDPSVCILGACGRKRRRAVAMPPAMKPYSC